MYVFDSSAFINGARHHYYLNTMAAVWDLVEVAIEDGRVIVPREVFREVTFQEDDVSELLKRHKDAVVEPPEEVQSLAGIYQQRFFSGSELRDRADPWIMAEAEVRGATIVTYEGITFSGAAARGSAQKLPAICAQVGLKCCTLAQALQDLGLNLR